MSTELDLESELSTHLSRFGLRAFRPGQLEVISAVVAGHDCLCIMPTGGGKSLCYQLPSVARDGVTLVVSPLIALMKDQVDTLQAIGIEATCINSSLPYDEQLLRLNRLAAGDYDLVYIAPERLRNRRFLEAIAEVRVQLLAIDEAHCISEWGHDFRPDYARLAMFRQRLGQPQTIALTATATSRVRDDIVASLGLREPKTFVTGFARPNLHFSVLSTATVREKEEVLLGFLEQHPGAGIIYASTRKRCEEVAEMIGPRIDRRIGVYHAGLLPNERRQMQEAFMGGEVPIIVATNAFGMGIDKPDLRFVVHYNIPGSLEAYYQEAGRAGRDGQDSHCTLLFNYADRYVQEFFIESAYPPAEVVRQVYEYLASSKDDPIELTLQEVKERLGLSISSEGVGTCEQLLEKAGIIERLDSSENLASIRMDHELPTAVDLLPREAKTQRKVLRALEGIAGERRGERVYFQLRTLMQKTELEREPLNRALRELSKHQWVDYVQPFRGRAVHFRQRGVPFDKLEIDFASLDQRRAAEYAKLDQVLQYASTRRCRQVQILDYFGDPSRERCGNCDNCWAAGHRRKVTPQTSRLPTSQHECLATTQVDAEVTSRGAAAKLSGPDHEAILEVVRIALSGVARAGGRVGKQLIAQMLWGSKSTKVKQCRLNSLSTFGLLSHLKQQDVYELLDCLISARMVEQTETQRFRPVVRLTDLGGNVMRGIEGPPAGFGLPRSIMEKLQSRRHHRANSPPAASPGVSPAPTSRLAANGPLALGEESGTGNSPANSPPVPSSHPPISPVPVDLLKVFSGNGRNSFDEDSQAVSPAARPGYFWTWLILKGGYSPAECEQIRRLSPEEVLDHAVQAAEAGYWVPPEWFLTEQQLTQLRDLAGSGLEPRELASRNAEICRHQHLRLWQLAQSCPNGHSRQP